jgi:hypothetical protein
MVLPIARQLSPAARRLSASACWKSVSFGLRPNLVPLALANGAALVRPLDDALALRLSDAAEQRKHALPDGTGQIDCGSIPAP